MKLPQIEFAVLKHSAIQLLQPLEAPKWRRISIAIAQFSPTKIHSDSENNIYTIRMECAMDRITNMQ
jgi:hypothetical protein